MKRDDNLEKSLFRLNRSKSWGEYHLGYFYFTINTGINIDEINKGTLTNEYLSDLQNKNYPAIFHEYIHYIHEISTIQSNLATLYAISRISIFTHFLEKDENSSVYGGIQKGKLFEKYVKSFTGEGILLGDTITKDENGYFIKVCSCEEFEYQEIPIPAGLDYIDHRMKIPKICIVFYKDNNYFTDFIKLGKYYLYEGLAYELDRVVDKVVYEKDVINDNFKNSEYTVIRQIARFICPQITTKHFLTIASLSLNYLNTGETFILMLNEYKAIFELSENIEAFIELKKNSCKHLLKTKKAEYISQINEFKRIYKGRQVFYAAYSFLTNQLENAYEQRIIDPTFEIELVYNKQYDKLFKIIPFCDYIYTFNSENDLNRDYIGTYQDNFISNNLKAMQCSVHYFKLHNYYPIYSTDQIENNGKIDIEKFKCPFYYCCNVDLRKQNSKICKTKPWRIFEISKSSDKLYCWYGQGVLECKGLSKPIK